MTLQEIISSMTDDQFMAFQKVVSDEEWSRFASHKAYVPLNDGRFLVADCHYGDYPKADIHISDDTAASDGSSLRQAVEYHDDEEEPYLKAYMYEDGCDDVTDTYRWSEEKSSIHAEEPGATV